MRGWTDRWSNEIASLNVTGMEICAISLPTLFLKTDMRLPSSLGIGTGSVVRHSTLGSSTTTGDGAEEGAGALARRPKESSGRAVS